MQVQQMALLALSRVAPTRKLVASELLCQAQQIPGGIARGEEREPKIPVAQLQRFPLRCRQTDRMIRADRRWLFPGSRWLLDRLAGFRWQSRKTKHGVLPLHLLGTPKNQRGSELLIIPHWICIRQGLLQADPMDKTTSEDSRTSSGIRVIS